MCAFSFKLHWRFAFLLWIMFVGFGGPINNPIPFLIGSVFPDADIKSSPMGKIVPLHWFFNHRGWVHSLQALVVFSAPISLYNWKWSISFALGYLLHLAMDDSTPMRIRWWAGHKRKRAYH